MAPPPLGHPSFEPGQVAGAAEGPSGQDPQFPLSGAGAWWVAQAAEEAGEVWQDNHDKSDSMCDDLKAARPQTKTERQQMLNKAAQQRCAAVIACLVQRLWPGCSHA